MQWHPCPEVSTAVLVYLLIIGLKMIYLPRKTFTAHLVCQFVPFATLFDAILSNSLSVICGNRMGVPSV